MVSLDVHTQPTHKVGIDELPPDTLDDVVRFLSERPRDVEWVRHIRPEHLATLSRDIGPLTRAAQRCISTLNLTVGSDADCTDVHDILRTLGTNCVTLHLTAYTAPPATKTWLSAYSQWAVNVRSMTLTLGQSGPPADALLAPMGSVLERLRIDVDPRAASALYDAASRHCTALHTLDLQIAFRNARGLRALLAKAGRTLVDLTLTVRDAVLSDVSDAEALNLRRIAALCPHLTSLALYGNLRAARGDAELLARLLGPQLQRLVFPFAGASEPFLHNLAASCPNASIETEMTPPGQQLDDFLHGERADPAPTMRILGKQLTALQLRDGFRRSPAFAVAAAAATNLRSLEITDCGRDTAAMLNDFFAVPRDTLAELRIAFARPRALYPLSRVLDALAVVARATRSLTYFALSGPLLPGGAFDAVAMANLNMEHALISMRSGPRTPEDDEVRQIDKVASVVSAIEAFAACATLRFLTIEDSSVNPWPEGAIPEPVRGICRSLSDRRICIAVDGVSCLK